MHKRITVIVGLIVVSMIVTACGQRPRENTPTASPVSTSTLLPTSTSTSIPTDTPTPNPTATFLPTATPTEKPTAITNKTIRIASQSPLSGNTEQVGNDIRMGAQLAVDQLSGPLNDMGFNVELIPFDDQGKTDSGVNNAKAIVADPTILCVVGHYNSGVQIPSSEEYHAAGLANVSPANTNPRVTDRGYAEISRLIGRDDMQGAAAAQFAHDQGIRSAYLLHDETNYGQSAAETFQKQAEKLGIQILDIKGVYDPSKLSTVLPALLASKPELIYFGGMYDLGAEIVKQARDKGFNGMFVSVDGFDTPEAAQIGGEALLGGQGSYFSVTNGPIDFYEDAAQFRVDFQATYGTDPGPFAALSYDAAAICLKAIENAARANQSEFPPRETVAQAIRALQDFPGVTGVINFDANGDRINAPYLFIHVISADPAEWVNNLLVKTYHISPP